MIDSTGKCDFIKEKLTLDFYAEFLYLFLKCLQVLTLNEGDEMAWKWAYIGDIPANAVSCDDSVLGGDDNCYLGVSMYSDGICRESIGKISADEGLIHFVMNQRPFMCPFFLYLTVSPGQDSSIQLTPKDKYQVDVGSNQVIE